MRKEGRRWMVCCLGFKGGKRREEKRESATNGHPPRDHKGSLRITRDHLS
jgi:hypothetical protein